VAASGDLEIVESREYNLFCGGEKVPAVHAPLNCSDTHRRSENFTAEEWLLVKEEELALWRGRRRGYLWHGNWYVRNILIVVTCRLEMSI
jgi:hypothetical protein